MQTCRGCCLPHAGDQPQQCSMARLYKKSSHMHTCYLQVPGSHPLAAYLGRRIIRLALTLQKQLTLDLAPAAAARSSTAGPAAGAVEEDRTAAAAAAADPPTPSPAAAQPACTAGCSHQSAATATPVVVSRKRSRPAAAVAALDQTPGRDNKPRLDPHPCQAESRQQSQQQQQQSRLVPNLAAITLKLPGWLLQVRKVLLVVLQLPSTRQGAPHLDRLVQQQHQDAAMMHNRTITWCSSLRSLTDPRLQLACPACKEPQMPKAHTQASKPALQDLHLLKLAMQHVLQAPAQVQYQAHT